MEICDTLKMFLQRCRVKMTCSEDIDLPESYSEQSSYSRQTSSETTRQTSIQNSSKARISDIETAERAYLASLIQHAEKLCASQKARNDTVLERLGLSLQQDTFPPPQPTAFLSREPQSSVRGRRIRPIVDVEDSIFACEEAKLSEDISFDTQTPAELTPNFRDFTPNPPPPRAPTRRPPRIPVMTVKPGGVGKKVAGGYKLQSVKSQMDDMFKTLEKIQHIRHATHQPPGPPSTATPSNRKGLHCGTPEVAPKVPTPPSKPALPTRKGPHRGTKLCPQRAVVHQVDLQPLANPEETLSFCFKQLASEDWEKKMDGLKSVQALARHHSGLLQTKLHEVCLVLAEEVNNLRSSVSGAAMETVRELHVQLGRAMDSMVERTGRVLLLKLAGTTSAFIHQQANLALDALVEGCSPGRISGVLVNTGLNHCCAAVRASTALHLQQLADIIGMDHILKAGKTFTERFLFAVSKMAVDAAPEVR
ncbi:uncharacterized protein LOC131985282 [Centropristis striata]|uniref:uncharacterized protein LOC131985282 n=1 Tax=Centropristis striata TaxID=184440 RepID=UPI0027DF892E|nr:uncharacterized protein LOC131985282 [Centropristis striata]